MEKKIIIFGALGFIGYELAKKLCHLEFKVDLIDINIDLTLKNQLKKKFKKSVRFFQLNLKDKESFKKINFKNYDYIFDCAAFLGVDKIINKSYESLINNIEIPVNISAFALKQKRLKKIIFMSSSEVYDGGLLNNISHPPNKEETLLTLSDLQHPRSVYMFSKVAGEMIYINSKLPYVNLRLHNVFGPRMCKTHSIPTFIKKFLSKKKHIEVYNKNHSRSYIFIDDAIDQIIGVSVDSKIKNRTLNIGNDKNLYKNYQLVLQIKKLMNLDKKIIYKKDNKNSVHFRQPSLKNLNKIYNFKDKKNFISQLRKTIDFYEKKQ